MPGGIAFALERAGFFDARRFQLRRVGRIKILPRAVAAGEFVQDFFEAAVFRPPPGEAFAQPGEVLPRLFAPRQAHQQLARAFFDAFAAVFQRGGEEGLVGVAEVCAEDFDVVLAVVGRRAAPDGGELFARGVGVVAAQAGEVCLARGKRQQLPVFFVFCVIRAVFVFARADACSGEEPATTRAEQGFGDVGGVVLAVAGGFRQ